MSKVVFKIADNILFQKIIIHLEENNIEYFARKMDDSAFPVLNQEQEIEVSEKFADEVSKFLEEDVQKVIVEEPNNPIASKPSKNNNFFIIALSIYAIVISLVALRYWYISQKIDKNFDYQWSADNTTLTLRNKYIKGFVVKYYDANYDDNWEKVEAFSNGDLKSISVDLNENGLLEKTTDFNSLGEINGIYDDDDENGIFDRSLIILENGDTLSFVDTNKNGVMELKK